MPSLELNAEQDEVKASGARGYILLYLDNKPSMRWRFYESMKLKLEWDADIKLPPVNKIKSSFPFERKRSAKLLCKPSSNCSQEQNKTQEQYPPLSPSRNKKLKLSSPLSATTEPLAAEVQKQTASLSTPATYDDNEDDDIAYGNVSEDSSFSGNRLSFTAVKPEPLLEDHNPHVEIEQKGMLDSGDSSLQVNQSYMCDTIFENKKEVNSFKHAQEEGETLFGVSSVNRSSAHEQAQRFSEVNKISTQKQAPGYPLVSADEKLNPRKTIGQESQMRTNGGKICELCKKPYSTLHGHFGASKKRLECPYCSLLFKSQAHLILHQYVVHDIKSVESEDDNLPADDRNSSFSEFGKEYNGVKGWHPCPVCGKKYRYCNLVNHIKNLHTKEHVFKCCICDKEFKSIKQVKEHIKAHYGIESEKGKWHCSLCPAVFTSCGEFHRHSNNIHRAVCAFCHKDFSFRRLLNEHLQKEHKDKLLACRICGHEVATKKQLWTHERYHRYKNAIPCHVCGVLINRTCLKAHLKSHEESKEDGSEKTSSAPDALHNDRDTNGQVNNNKYLCTMCPETFPTEGWLVRHLTTIHKQILGFKCPQCPKRFASKSRLAHHILRHISFDKKSHICSVCGKAFGTNFSLKVHMNIHEPVKSFRCDICNQGFNYKVSLKAHMVSKHGIAKNK